MGVVSALAHISLLTSTWSSWFSLSSSPPPLLPPASSVWLATLTELLFPLTSLLLLLPVLTTSVPWLSPMELPLAMLLPLSPLMSPLLLLPVLTTLLPEVARLPLLWLPLSLLLLPLWLLPLPLLLLTDMLDLSI